MNYEVPIMEEIDVDSIDLMCACTTSDSNPYNVTG